MKKMLLWFKNTCYMYTPCPTNLLLLIVNKTLMGSDTVASVFHIPFKMRQLLMNLGKVHYRRCHPCDTMVVPYCLPLLCMYRCHINFEVARAAHLFQYMFKYIHKGISSLTSMVINHSSPFLGPDTAKVHIKHSDAVVDEIEDFWQARYLSTGEAAWQILGFCLTTKDPAVTALPVHAPHSLLHLQYSHVDHQSSPMSKLDHYFIHPQGFFFDENLNCTSFDDLTYAEYY